MDMDINIIDTNCKLMIEGNKYFNVQLDTLSISNKRSINKQRLFNFDSNRQEFDIEGIACDNYYLGLQGMKL